MNLFNNFGSGPSVIPRTPQIPQIPSPFGFGLSTITDFIGLTDPIPAPAPIPQHQQPPIQRPQQQQQLRNNVGLYEEQQQNFHGNYYQPQNFAENQYSSPSPMTSITHPETASIQINPYSFENTTSNQPNQYPFPNPGNYQSLGPPSPPLSSQTQYQPQQQQIYTLPTSTSAFVTISIPSISQSIDTNQPLLNTSSAPVTTSTSSLPPPPSLQVLPTTSRDGALNDLTGRTASPFSSGVQIDLINLRQKLFRDIQNNMDTVTKQKITIEDLQNRADLMKTDYAHLKCSMEDLKRKSKEQEGKLKEIDSLVKSALTMSSFSSPTSLEIVLIEAENEMDTSIRVFAAESLEC